MSRVTRARFGLNLGFLMVAVGAGLAFGVGIGLIAGGVAMSTSFLLMFDVDETKVEP